MDFAGNDYIYFPKPKKEEIAKIKKNINKINSNNNGEMEIDSEDSDDGYITVDSKNFNIDLENSQINPQTNLDTTGIKYKKPIDTNVCVIRYKTLEKESEKTVLQLYKCKKCNGYLIRYSYLIPLPEKDKYNWICEFCFNMNQNLYIENCNLPIKDCVEKCVCEPQKLNKHNEDDDTSLILCLDTSESMSDSYKIDETLSEQLSKIRGNKIGYSITRLELVKLAMENTINSLLKKYPKVKVGLITFGTEVTIKGDCLSNLLIVKENDLYKESNLESIGKNNTNLIKSEINISSKELIKSIREIKEEGNTTLGPAVLLGLSLLNEAKIGSRIFVCTDGESNKGVGTFWNTEEKVKEFYIKMGNIAKEKGIVISLIAFEDCESKIDILKNMVYNSGGDIFRVNPNMILDEVNDFLENKALASQVEIKINLNKCMTFRDEEKNDIINDGSTILKNIGNVTKEKETYFELKFKHAEQLAKIKEINYDDFAFLIFQIEIIYRKKKEENILE